jgi:hypothetical protein
MQQNNIITGTNAKIRKDYTIQSATNGNQQPILLRNEAGLLKMSFEFI